MYDECYDAEIFVDQCFCVEVFVSESKSWWKMVTANDDHCDLIHLMLMCDLFVNCS